jgi:hypothetical protein
VDVAAGLFVGTDTLVADGEGVLVAPGVAEEFGVCVELVGAGVGVVAAGLFVGTDTLVADGVGALVAEPVELVGTGVGVRAVSVGPAVVADGVGVGVGTVTGKEGRTAASLLTSSQVLRNASSG